MVLLVQVVGGVIIDHGAGIVGTGIDMVLLQQPLLIQHVDRGGGVVDVRLHLQPSRADLQLCTQRVLMARLLVQGVHAGDRRRVGVVVQVRVIAGAHHGRTLAASHRPAVVHLALDELLVLDAGSGALVLHQQLLLVNNLAGVLLLQYFGRA